MLCKENKTCQIQELFFLLTSESIWYPLRRGQWSLKSYINHPCYHLSYRIVKGLSPTITVGTAFFGTFLHERMKYCRLWLVVLHPNWYPVFWPFFEDFQIRVSDSSFHILLNSEWKCNIYISKSKFECWQAEKNQIIKHFGFFFLLTRYICITFIMYV